MKFVTLKENLKQGLTIVSHLTSKNINLPILNNILIKAKKEGVELTATNLEISINHFLRGKIEKEGEFTVDAKIINEYIALLPEDKIEVELLEEELKIECQNYKTKIKGQFSNDFPVLPKIDQSDFFSFEINSFKEALSSVAFSVSNNENRIELSGVYFSFNEENLVLVGTDSYRLSEKTIKLKNKKNNDFKKNIIVPVKTIQELIRILSNFKTEDQIEAEDEIRIYLTENQIFFSFGLTNISSRIIIGNYPDYKQIIPQNEKTTVIINKASFVRAVKASGLFSKTGINDINLNFIKNKILISSSSSQAGENFIEMNATIKGADNEIFINYKYLLEGLNNINSDNIIMKVIDNNTPCIIKAEKEDDFLYLVMPIKQ
ncbi:MAG: DNA polymerase III subunit beta [Patescibacteria group bacterium]|nr:DNA polymerase III subunit beta [Patescibacteria group bacterium]